MQTNAVVEAEKKLPEALELRELCEAGGPCITMYLSGHRGGSGSRPRTTRLRRMIAQADALLEERQIAVTDRQRLIEPVRELLNAPEIDTGDAGTLAVFRSSRLMRVFRLPLAVDDNVVVEGRLFVVPMVSAMNAGRNFFLLALSRNNTRLFECGADHFKLLPLPGGLPGSVEAFEGMDIPGHDTLSRAPTGVQFGASAFREKQHRYVHDYCVALDRAMQPMLSARKMPLVVIGATAELSAFPGEAVKVDGSPDGGWTDFELAEKGRQAMRDWHSLSERVAIESFEKAAPAKALTELEEIVRAAAGGRVLHLFLAVSPDQNLGDLDRILGRTLLSGEIRSSADDLVNAAVVETLRHNGHVWSGLPTGCPTVGALLRY